MKYYPSYVYSANETFTRQNMAEYDREEREMSKEVERLEKEKGRSLTLRERSELSDKYHNR